MPELTPSSPEPADEVVNLAGSIFGGVIVCTSLLVMALFCFSVFGRYSYAAELVGNFRAQILVLLLPCTVLAVLFQRWYIGIALLICTAWCSTGVLSVYLPTAQPPAGEKQIRIMSFNVLASSDAYEKVKKQVGTIDPDVLLIVEYDREWHDALRPLIDEGTYPHHQCAPRWHGFGIAVFSKFPIVDQQIAQLTPNETDVPMAICDLEIGKQQLRLAGVHVLSPTSRYRMDLRNQQFEEAAQILSKSDLPTIVAGDFNCTPWSPFLTQFLDKTGYRDSRHGFGYQGTWNSQYHWPALIPIDHAFVSPEIHVHNRFVGQSTSSDHYPIIFDVSIRP